MKTLVLNVVLGSVLLLAAQRQDERTKEPREIFSLEIDGKRVPIEIDQPIDLPTPAAATKMILRVEPHRVFDISGLTFHYPREMGFEADLENEGVAIWSLNGSSAMIMVQNFEGQTGPDAELRDQVAEGMISQYGKRNCTRGPSTLVLESGKLTGEEINVTLAGARLSQALYSFPTPNGTMVIILQDLLNEDGSHTEEFRRVESMLTKSLRLPEQRD